jgi:hypothetical protein
MYYDGVSVLFLMFTHLHPSALCELCVTIFVDTVPKTDVWHFLAEYLFI